MGRIIEVTSRDIKEEQERIAKEAEEERAAKKAEELRKLREKV